MKSLVSAPGDSLMSSIDLLDLINRARLESGEKDVRRNDFHARVRDELDGEHYERFVVLNANDTESEAYRLTLRQCMCVAMRESKSVRRQVQSRLEAQAAPALPQTFADALRLAADEHERRQAAEAERDEAVRTKSLIGSRREATAMATASAAKREAAKLEIELDKSKEYATVKRMEMLYHGTSFNWRLLKSTAAEMGVPAIDVFDANYGTVKAYHASVWAEAYAVAIGAEVRA